MNPFNGGSPQIARAAIKNNAAVWGHTDNSLTDRNKIQTGSTSSFSSINHCNSKYKFDQNQNKNRN